MSSSVLGAAALELLVLQSSGRDLFSSTVQCEQTPRAYHHVESMRIALRLHSGLTPLTVQDPAPLSVILRPVYATG